MPVGFYDDPSFRWSADTGENLDSAQAAGATIVHILANWAQIAPTKPANPLDGDDPAYRLSDIDKIVRRGASTGCRSC